MNAERGTRNAQQRPKLAPVTTITERELAGRFHAAPGSPLYEAVLVVIEQRIVASLDAAVDPALTDRDHRWQLGGADALIALRDDLREREHAARVLKEGEEKAA